MTHLVVFDLDYTLTRRGTWGRFVAMGLRSRPWAWPGLVVSAGLTQLAYRLGLTERVTVKRMMMRWAFPKTDRQRISELADRFVAKEVTKGLLPCMIERMRRHQADGDTVLVASAGVCALISLLTEELGADGWVATEFDFDDNDCLETDFATPNCYGAEKLRRVQQWVDERGITPDRITVYSDSCADAPLFAVADRPVVVARKAKARRFAREKGYEFLEIPSLPVGSV